MNSIEFGKKCRPYNSQYKDIFGYVSCRGDYNCSQDEYFQVLLKAIETNCEYLEKGITYHLYRDKSNRHSVHSSAYLLERQPCNKSRP